VKPAVAAILTDLKFMAPIILTAMGKIMSMNMNMIMDMIILTPTHILMTMTTSIHMIRLIRKLSN
jgi:hypothetical protein